MQEIRTVAFLMPYIMPFVVPRLYNTNDKRISSLGPGADHFAGLAGAIYWYA
jgi:hypothetical protein